MKLLSWFFLVGVSGCIGMAVPNDLEPTGDIDERDDADVIDWGDTNSVADNDGDSTNTSPDDDPSDRDPPVIVRPCDDLPAIGVWEKVTPPGIADLMVPTSIGMVSVAVDPLDPATVYAAGGSQTCPTCGSQGLWKSTDCGATWTHINTGRNGHQLDTGFQWGLIQIGTDNPQSIYVVNGYGSGKTLWKSTNGGVDWDPAWGDEISQHLNIDFVSIVAMDPDDSKHVVVSFHDYCKPPYANMCMAETTDGENWRLFDGPTDNWIEGAGPVILGPTTILYAAPFTGIFYSDDSGANWEKVAPDAFFQLYRDTNGVSYLGSAQHGIARSTDGYNWSYIPNTASATGIVGDGERIFASFQQDHSGQPIFAAYESAPNTWVRLATPTMASGGSILAYDNVHKILYSANYGAGLWRVVTRE